MERQGEAVRVRLKLNHEDRSFLVSERRTLLQLIREDAGLTGTKKGCDLGECGACTVILNGRAVNSCCVLAVQADGGDVVTIEGLGTADRLHPVQRAFVELGAIQCGHGAQREGAAGPRAPSHARGDPRGDVRQPLPLHRLRQDRGRRAPRGGAPCGIRRKGVPAAWRNSVNSARSAGASRATSP